MVFKMRQSLSFFCLVASILLNISYVNSEENYCGLSQPDHEKTCVSVRLPWQANPIYFCTEKENINYNQQCPQIAQHINCPKIWNEKSLLIGTPWDCCPLISQPNIIEDVCKQVFCPPKPLNRTCQTIKNPNECCPKYFCEPDAPSGNCNFKLLEPDCGMPPKDKTNCIAFKDPYGCCDKYQCDGEGKPGTCPNIHFHNYPYQQHTPYSNQHFKKLVNHARNLVANTSSVPHGNHAAVNSPSTVAFFVAQRYASAHVEHANYNQLNLIPCVGDYNCPESMKCCGSGAIMFHEIHARYMRKADFANQKEKSMHVNTVAMSGFCANPVPNVNQPNIPTDPSTGQTRTSREPYPMPDKNPVSDAELTSED